MHVSDIPGMEGVTILTHPDTLVASVAGAIREEEPEVEVVDAEAEGETEDEEESDEEAPTEESQS